MKRFHEDLKTILLVDTSVNQRLPIKWFLENFGYVVDSVGNAEEALTVFDAVMHDMVITDLAIHGMTGTEVAHVIKLRSPSTPVVLYSRQTPEDASGFDAIVKKPQGTPVERELLKLKETLDSLSGPSKGGRRSGGGKEPPRGRRRF